jgi:hypothetical protein
VGSYRKLGIKLKIKTRSRETEKQEKDGGRVFG